MSTSDTQKIPVTVLTGYLGSGKTTVLNHILKENHGRRIAVIENEFGAVGIDSDLVLHEDEEIFETNNGCICCTVRGDLIRILGNLMKRRNKFDRVLIETTGVADPGPVAQTFYRDDEIAKGFVLDGITTLVDAKHFLLQLRNGVEPARQVAFADQVLITKTDLVSASELKAVEDRIRRINAVVPIARAEMGRVDLEKILNLGGFDLKRATNLDPHFLEAEDDHHHHDHGISVTSVPLTTDKPLDVKKLNVWLGLLMQTKGNDIYRMKGIVQIKNLPNRFVFHGVHMMLDGKPDRPWGTEKPTTKMIFIGKGLNSEELRVGFEACIDG